MEENILRQLPGALLPWYEENKRDLPWRQDREPYHVWLSEIMLQQTRVEAVKGYYIRFLQALPTIADLAQCPEEQLHKLWEGLGYYSRVRNLKKAAITVMEDYGGIFPRKYEDVLSLPGIGVYTAGAVCSICYDRPTPAVDGNVLRVLSRVLNDPSPIDLPAAKSAALERLKAVYPARAGDFTQALMELGATVCGPNRRPDCAACPCQDFCRACAAGTAESLPVKLPKRSRKDERLTVFILECDGRFALCSRENKGLLAGLWQFPNVHGTLSPEQALAALEEKGLRPRELLRQSEKQHIFTHIRWEMRGFYVRVLECAGDYSWLTAREIEDQAALPTAFRQFWEDRHHV